MKKQIKAFLAKTPYTIRRRTQINRFSAVPEALQSLAQRGASPDLIIDGGANVGQFSSEMLALFPSSVIHAVEPQPGCLAPLQLLANRHPGRLVIHATALGAPENSGSMLTLATDTEQRSTGAHISRDNEAKPHTVQVPCATLDELLNRVDAQRALLKLDLQGYELHALMGAERILQRTDVVLTEVSFYAQAYEPPISALIALLGAAGFELYDIATIYARPRDDRPRQGDFLFVRRDSALAADTRWD